MPRPCYGLFARRTWSWLVKIWTKIRLLHLILVMKSCLSCTFGANSSLKSLQVLLWHCYSQTRSDNCIRGYKNKKDFYILSFKQKIAEFLALYSRLGRNFLKSGLVRLNTYCWFLTGKKKKEEKRRKNLRRSANSLYGERTERVIMLVGKKLRKQRCPETNTVWMKSFTILIQRPLPLWGVCWLRSDHLHWQICKS